MTTQRLRFLLLSLLLLGFVIQGAYLLSTWSLTADEAIHCAAGYLRLKMGLPNDGFRNPPLIQNLFGLPYILSNRSYVPRKDVPRLARAMNLFLGFALALAIYCASKRCFGPWGAALSLSCYVLSPSFIAHSSLSTLDVGVALFSFVTFFFLWEGYAKGQHFSWNVLVGLSMGCALAAKFTSLTFAVLLPLALLYLMSQRESSWLKFVLATLVILFCAWLIFSATYRFHGCFANKAPDNWPSYLKLAVKPLPECAVFSFRKKMEQAKFGGFAFLWGQKKMGGFWYYYPVVFLLKTLPGTLLLLFVLVFLLIGRLMPPKREILFYGGIGLCYFLALSAVNRSQSGLRHLFPLYPFLFVSLGALVENMTPRRKSVIIFAISLNLLASFSSFPHHLSYFNIFGTLYEGEGPPIGGPDLDWGQDDGALVDKLHELPEGTPVFVNPIPVGVPRNGYIAISATARYFVPKATEEKKYNWLANKEPIARIGKSWSIYYVEGVPSVVIPVASSPSKQLENELRMYQNLGFCPNKVTGLRQLVLKYSSQRAMDTLIELTDRYPQYYHLGLQFIDVWFGQREGTVRVNSGANNLFDNLDPRSGLWKKPLNKGRARQR